MRALFAGVQNAHQLLETKPKSLTDAICTSVSQGVLGNLGRNDVGPDAVKHRKCLLGQSRAAVTRYFYGTFQLHVQSLLSHPRETFLH
jgi:hypothetical protein